MRYAVVFMLLSGTALAQPYMPPANPAEAPPAMPDGARPGNDIGTGMSLPRSDRAGNINGATTHSELAPNLPAPAGVDNVHDLLVTARNALAANQTGAAQEALERAETRALDRDIAPGTERVPDQSPAVAGIAQARDALGNNNIRGAIAIVDNLLRQ
jgi:hypothetical protein